AELGDVRAIDEHAAPVGAQEPDQVPGEDRLAAAAPAGDHRDRAGGDLEVEPAQDLLAPERLDEPLDLNHRLASAVARPAARTATITDSPRPSHGLRLARPPSQTRLGRRTARRSHGHHHAALTGAPCP